MKRPEGITRLLRNLRRGKHEDLAIQKALARVRAEQRSVQADVRPKNDLIGGEEPHGQVDDPEKHLQDAGMRTTRTI